MTQFGFNSSFDTMLKNFAYTNRARTAIERDQLEALKNVGSYLVIVSKNSIRQVGKLGKPSAPGKPPKSRVGTLKRLILFAYFQRLSGGHAIAGPAKIDHSSSLKPISKTVPEVLEYGGMVRLAKDVRVRARSLSNTLLRKIAINQERTRVGQLQRKRKVKNSSFVTLNAGHYFLRERPYMRPALEKTQNAARMQRWFGQLKRLQ